MPEFPKWRGKLEYQCVSCGAKFPGDELLYACPKCKGVFLLKDVKFDELKKTPAAEWRRIFDGRQATRIAALRGIFRFYELTAPVLEEEDIVYLGEANTPIITAAKRLVEKTGVEFAYKNDGQNPSASFKDRGMACAFSFLRKLCREKNLKEILAICASTGDTSAAAALYGAYVGPPIKTAVILPKGKVTPEQLSQPLGSGARVIEMPGVFDDCMKVVENLAEHYPVALLNSKNSWRILGQESYAFEVAQWHGWDVSSLCVFAPIGNAGNITAIMDGFLKLFDLKIITSLPRIFGVQSNHANPVFKYYDAPKETRQWQPMQVAPSVAQAAMIGNPVSFPRVAVLAEKFVDLAGSAAFNVVSVTEQEIIEAMLEANYHGHIACTQGGECLAGLKKAISQGKISGSERAVLDSTAHMLKFASFQQKYFTNSLGPEYEITPDKNLANAPLEIGGEPGHPAETARVIAKILDLAPGKDKS